MLFVISLYTPENMKKLEAGHSQEEMDFWKNLKTGYDLFEKNKTKISTIIDAKGNYMFK